MKMAQKLHANPKQEAGSVSCFLPWNRNLAKQPKLSSPCHILVPTLQNYLKKPSTKAKTVARTQTEIRMGFYKLIHQKIIFQKHWSNKLRSRQIHHLLTSNSSPKKRMLGWEPASSCQPALGTKSLPLNPYSWFQHNSISKTDPTIQILRIFKFTMLLPVATKEHPQKLDTA